MVVDDFEDARDLYCTALEAAGFVAVDADGGAAALNAIADSRPDLVILDISMPGMNGWQVVRHLRAREATRVLPIIVLTGNGTGGVVSPEEPGCAAYLLKPCSPAALIEVVCAVLSQQARQHEAWTG